MSDKENNTNKEQTGCETNEDLCALAETIISRRNLLERTGKAVSGTLAFFSLSVFSNEPAEACYPPCETCTNVCGDGCGDCDEPPCDGCANVGCGEGCG